MHDIKEKNLNDINKNLEEINYKMGNYWFSLSRGLLTGFGSVLGAGIAILLIGWFLNIIGVIPALRNYTDSLKGAFQQTQNNKSFLPSDSTATPAK